MNRITETDSLYDGLENMSTQDLLNGINQEDQKVALAIEKILPEITLFIDEAIGNMQKGGRLFYLGAGTSGRLGIVDASECPPTFGVEHGLVVGIIAGGDQAIRKAVEFAEDDSEQAILDLLDYNVCEKDFVLGLSASGSTPYVYGGILACNSRGITTASICCSKGSKIGSISHFPIEVEVGPEIITGSTRMKSGTAQKMVLNIITSTAMVKLGKVEGSKMVNMQLSNHKLIDRGTRMVAEQTGLEYEKAKSLLIQFGSVKLAADFFKANH